MIQSKLISITDDGTLIRVLVTMLVALPGGSDVDHLLAEEEYFLINAGYALGHSPRYMMMSEISGGNPIESSINQWTWDVGSTMWQAFKKIQETWDDLNAVDTVDVEAEREEYFDIQNTRFAE